MLQMGKNNTKLVTMLEVLKSHIIRSFQGYEGNEEKILSKLLSIIEE